MKDKLKNSSDSDWVQYKQDFSKGDASSYWNWTHRKGANPDLNNEYPSANPDMLTEKQGLWFRDASTEEQKALCKELLQQLTPKQRQILELVGYEGKTYSHAAAILGVKKGTIQKTIEQIRRKLLSYEVPSGTDYIGE